MHPPSSPLKRTRGQAASAAAASGGSSAEDDGIPGNGKRSKQEDASVGAFDPAVAASVEAPSVSLPTTSNASLPSSTNGTSTAKHSPPSGLSAPTQKVPATASNQQEIGLPPPSLSSSSSGIPVEATGVATTTAAAAAAPNLKNSGSKKTEKAPATPSSGADAATAAPRGRRFVRFLRWTGIVVVWCLPNLLLYGAWHDAASELEGSHRRIAELEATSAYMSTRAESLQLVLEERVVARDRDVRNLQNRLDAEIERTQQAQAECRRQP